MGWFIAGFVVGVAVTLALVVLAALVAGSDADDWAGRP